MNEPVVIDMRYNSENDIETQTDDIELKKDVYDNIIYDYIKSEIKNLLLWENRWKILSLTFTIFKYICLVSVPIFSLSAPYFTSHSVLLSYLAGSFASASLGFERLSKLAINISKTKQEKINAYFKKLNLNFKIESDSKFDNFSNSDLDNVDKLRKK